MSTFDDLSKRLFISLLSIIIIAVLIIFSDFFFMRIILAFVIAFVAMLAMLEYINLILKKNFALSKMILVGGVIFEVFSFFLVSQFPILKMLPLLVFFVLIIGLFLSEFKSIENSSGRIALSVLGLLYIAFPLGMLLPIFYIGAFDGQDGRIWIFYLLFVTKISDIGAYFGGKLFGKKKIFPMISPKKTVVGSVSGLILSLISSLLFLLLRGSFAFDITLAEAIVLGLFLGVFGQLGDLFESLIKRDAKVKDSSVIPAMGGMLDMLDSLMLNIPIMYFFLLG
jgi:phosphatidate cytidylyltransferase